MPIYIDLPEAYQQRLLDLADIHVRHYRHEVLFLLMQAIHRAWQEVEPERLQELDEALHDEEVRGGRSAMGAA